MQNEELRRIISKIDKKVNSICKKVDNHQGDIDIIYFRITEFKKELEIQKKQLKENKQNIVELFEISKKLLSEIKNELEKIRQQTENTLFNKLTKLFKTWQKKEL